MTKSKIALIIDSFFISISLSFILFLWLNTFYKNAKFVFILSILTFILLFIIIFYLFNKSNNKKLFKSSDEKYLNNCLNKLILMPDNEYINFICKLLNCTHLENYVFKHDNRILYINIKNELSSKEYFLVQEILIKKSIPIDKLYFIYRTKNKSFEDVTTISNLDINLINHDILSKAMSVNNIFPLKREQVEKTSFKKKIINNLKSKSDTITIKHFKEFFFSGISLLFLSLIIPFSNYYLIVGSILVILSIISLFRKNYKPNKENSDFLLK